MIEVKTDKRRNKQVIVIKDLKDLKLAYELKQKAKELNKKSCLLLSS